MFGTIERNERHGHRGRSGRGGACGRGGCARTSGSGFGCRRDGRGRGFGDMQRNGAAAYVPAAPTTAEPTTAEPAEAAPAKDAATPSAGVCPLCKNHCPLDAPSCAKGAAFAANLAGGNAEAAGRG